MARRAVDRITPPHVLPHCPADRAHSITELGQDRHLFRELSDWMVGHSEVGQDYCRKVVSGGTFLAPSGVPAEKRQWEKVRYAIQQVIREFPAVMSEVGAAVEATREPCPAPRQQDHRGLWGDRAAAGHGAGVLSGGPAADRRGGGF